MPRKRYRMIGLPEDLYLQCEKIVKSGRHGYSSVSELVKESVRRRLEELRRYFREEEKPERCGMEEP
ncbi:MAG: hypothetical protein DRJ98_08565 [Thermoprotei archaeon]|nr:MAG: hypothetical protein B6U84_06320 [Candidatus Bathyarchaeota archaeon ex4484_40]RJS77616.1 MAG: hypothetical protein CW711_06295 [Candidatus Bathyarchaeota archaeon]RLF09172.1 MAG: hypothetical protein DRJ98_08565 [Thermoprotei archaeon]